MKRLGGKILRKNRDLRFNNNTTALIFGSFHQGKEQRFYFKKISLKSRQINFIYKP